MKTQLIQLDPSDDVISVRDKMGWSQTSRILLVWPEHGQILSRRLDLLLLQRHSTTLGAQLALVTQSPAVKEIARELHLPVFENSRQAQNVRWRGGRRRQFRPRRSGPVPEADSLRLQHRPAKPSWQEKPLARIGLFGVSMLAFCALILLFLPNGSITLQPERRVQSLTLPVAASPGVSSVNLAGELPTRYQSVVVEGRDSLPTTGSMMIPGESAIGAVRLTNLTTNAIRVPRGLMITTLDAIPVRFTTTQAGIVPEGTGQTITLQIQALVPGETGNLPSDSLAAIEGELGLSLSATNPYSTHGGTDTAAPAPNAQDRQRLARQLTQTLQKSALDDLQNSLSEGDLLLPTSLVLVDTLEESFTPPTGLPGDQLELTLRLGFEAMVVTASSLQALVVPVLDGNLPTGFTSIADTLAVSHSGFSSPDATGTVRWSLSAKRSVQAEIPPGAVLQLALGQPKEAVSEHLAAQLPLANTPQVQMQPSWWPRLPYLPFRIEVITK